MAPGNRKNPERASTSESRYMLREFMQDFPDDETCLNWLWRNRWSDDGEHARCPRCETRRSFKRYETGQQRQSWTCTTCGHHIHPTSGTIFHKSSTSLHLWFYAIYLMSQTRCGVSAKQIERELGVTYKTAWRMANLIRNKLMAQDDAPLSGSVEADETFVGGKKRANSKLDNEAHFLKKATVFAAVERGGRVKATTLPNTGAGNLHPAVRRFVLPSSILYTDELMAYRTVGREYKEHRRIRHAAQVYVEGDKGTQAVEGFFGLLKNGIRGTYHSVSKKWLQSYLNEFVFRYNTRNDPVDPFWTLLRRAAS